jgi:hypothetical protein
MAEDLTDGVAEAFLYDGDDVRVRLRLFPGSDDLVVTFTGRASKPPVAKGFGESYFDKRRISAIHFISKANHWWQTPEIGEAVERVRAAGLLDGYRRVILYGSSMGGYASLIQSRALNPDHILIISPQYSIDGQVVPFEKRWRNYAAKLSFDHDDMAAGLHPTARISVIVDPYFVPDMQHIRLIEKLRPLTLVPIPFAGHNTVRALEECGLMQGVVRDLLDDSFDSDAFRQDYRARRVRASLFWFGLTELLVSRGRAGWSALPAAIAADMIAKQSRMRDASLRLEILRTAIRTAVERRDAAGAQRWLGVLVDGDPGSAQTMLAQAQAAQLDDDAAGALALAEAARERLPNDGRAVALLIDAMARAGQEDRAYRFAQGVAAKQPRVGPIQMALARRQCAAEDYDALRETLQQTLRRGNRHSSVRVMLASEMWRRGRADPSRRQLAPVISGTEADPALREAAYALARRLGWKPEAERFMRRARRADRLYALIHSEFHRIDPLDPHAAMPAFVAAVESEAARLTLTAPRGHGLASAA